MTMNPQNLSLNVVGQAIVSTMNVGATISDINALKMAATSASSNNDFLNQVKNNQSWIKLSSVYHIPDYQVIKFFNTYSLKEVVDDRGLNALRTVDLTTGKNNIFIAGAKFPDEFLVGGVSRTGLYGGDVVQAKAVVDYFNRWKNQGIDMDGALISTNSLGAGVLGLAIPNLGVTLGSVVAFGGYGINTLALEKSNSYMLSQNGIPEGFANSAEFSAFMDNSRAGIASNYSGLEITNFVNKGDWIPQAITINKPFGLLTYLDGPPANSYTGSGIVDGLINQHPLSGYWYSINSAGNNSSPYVDRFVTAFGPAQNVLITDPADGKVKSVPISSTYRNFGPDVPDSAATYIVQPGDSLSKIAAANGWDYQTLINLNPQLPDKNFIQIGQKINGLAPVPTTNTLSVSTTVGTNTAATPTSSTDAASLGVSATNGLGSSASYSFGITPAATPNNTGWDVNTASGNYALAGYVATQGLRPGNGSVGLQVTLPPVIVTDMANVDYSLAGAAMNTTSTGLRFTLPVDPLILDLDGGGVALTSFADAPVQFDIDNDGSTQFNGSKEQTGWMAAGEGMVVQDLNGNGQIDGIAETLSEYYNGSSGGQTGQVGQSGQKRFASGFAALKSLDSNNDNQFTNADAAWSSLRVWVDANHDGKTDTGELKTFAQLGITSINLASTAQSGLVNNGNEVLASGTFTQTVNGLAKTKEALAARFIANPAGSVSTTTTTNGVAGTVTTTEAGTVNGQTTTQAKSYVSQNTNIAVSETLNVTTLGVNNIQGGAGKRKALASAHDANWNALPKLPLTSADV